MSHHILKREQGIKSYRKLIEKLENSLELATHVGIDELPDIRLLLDVDAEVVVLEESGVHSSSSETGQSAEGAIYGDITRREKLRVGLRGMLPI
jgi:hypothetical protein